MTVPTALSLLLLALPQEAPVTGTVVADSSRVPLPYATVEVVGGDRAVATNERGVFLLVSLPPGRHTLRASAIGYAPLERSVTVGEGAPVRVDFELAPRPVDLRGINVEVLSIPTVTGPAATRLDAETMVEVPALAEVDVLRSVEILPSVKAVSDYSTAPYVRGSTPDQTEILLDGFPVYNPYHLGGVYGAFNPDAVASVEVFPGAVPARHGGRLSSLVRIQTREGGQDRIRGRGGVGLLSSRLELDGPAPWVAGTFTAAARKSYRNFTGGGITGEGLIPRTMDTGFDDGFVKWTLAGDRGRSLEVLGFATREWVAMPESDNNVRYDWGWSSRLAGVRGTVPLAPALRVEAHAGYSDFETSLGSWWREIDQSITETVSADASMRDLVAGADLRWIGRRHEVGAGVEAVRTTMEYRADRVEDPPGGAWDEYVPRFDDDFSTTVVAAYVEDDWQVTDRVGLRLGVRWMAASELDPVVQPRAGLRVRLADFLSLTAGAGRYAQAVHSVKVEEAAGTSFMAYDLLRPVAPGMEVPTSEDVVVGVEFRKGPASARVDAFHKRFEDVPLPPIPSNPWRAAVIEPHDFTAGEGTTTGFEVLADLVREPISVWLSYAFQDTERTLDGFSYTPRFDRRHSVDAMTAFSLPDKLRLSVRGVYASGQPTTPVVGRFFPFVHQPARNGFGDEVGPKRNLLGEHNSIRMPDYFRVDVGGRVFFERDVLGRRVDFTVYAQLVNALNVTNTVYWDPSTTPAQADDPVWQLPPTLTAGLEWTF